MKLRLKGNSIRVRLDRRDIERLIDKGRVDDAVCSGRDWRSRTRWRRVWAPRGRPTAHYTDGCLTIRIDPDDADEWLAGDRVGFDYQQPVHGGVVRVLLDKDFACIDRPAGEEADDAYTFPNPSAVC